MPKGEKTPPKPTVARFALAANLRVLMDNYTKGFQRGISTRQIAEQGGPSYKTLDRMLNPYTDTGVNLDSVDAVAAFFNVETWQLLKPDPVVRRTQETPPKAVSIPAPAKRKA